MRIPSRSQAEQLLAQAEAANPGPWADHSRYTAQAAALLARSIPEIDAEVAYTYGLLDDIGRGKGVSDMRHVIDGYRVMLELGFPDVARICLTHSFPLQEVRSMKQNWDGTPEDYQWIGAFLNSIQYHRYDQLIQLCDALALPHGFCLIEKRLVDVALRRGVNEYTQAKWQATFAIQRALEEKIGHSIYQLLPGVVETTFK